MPFRRTRIMLGGRSIPLGARTKALYYRRKRYLAKRNANTRLATIGKVKRMIHQNAETKLVGYAFNASKNQQIIASVADVLPLLPQLPQGVTDNQRLGNRVTPKGILVNVTLTLRTDLEGYPKGSVIMPRILCLSQKAQSNLDGLLAGGMDASHLIDYGTGEHLFAGTLHDYHGPVNKEAFVVHKDIKTKISSNTVEQGMPITKTFKFWIKCPKNLTYNDNQTYPRNFAPFMAIGFAKPDNVVDDPQVSALQVFYTTTLYFEDD